jgi:hypothetical protein
MFGSAEVKRSPHSRNAEQKQTLRETKATAPPTNTTSIHSGNGNNSGSTYNR